MSKKELKIQIRISEEEKKDWEKFAQDNKFPSLSQCIRFAMNELIEKGITTFADVKVGGDKSEYKEVIKEIMGEWKEERNVLLQKMAELVSSDKEAKSIETKYKLSGKILKLLEHGNYGSEDIADIYGIPESDAISILNMLIDNKVVKFNKKMEYMLVNNNGVNNK
jgi:hypothetical protein